MSIDVQRLQVLHILCENLKNPQPQLVRSNDIADQLDLSLPETQLLLKVMNDMGVIESNVDGQLSLITSKGLHYLNRHIAPCGPLPAWP
jgi:predicted transcriptional regulator